MTTLDSAVLTGQPKSRSSLQSVSRVLLALSLVIVAALAIAFAVWALPANDDFVRATMPKKSGYLPYFKHLYLTWQGRWVSYGIEDAVLPRLDMIRFYPALIGGLAIVNLFGLYAVCRSFTRSAPRRFSLACTAGMAAVLWAMMPSLAETVYWFVGGLENVTVLALAGILLTALMHVRSDSLNIEPIATRPDNEPAESRNRGSSIAPAIFGSIAAILIAGFHEAYGSMLCIALAAGTVSAYWMRSRNRAVWLIVLIAAIAGLGIVVAAPGNRNRMHQDVAHRVRSMSTICTIAGRQFWNSTRAWVFDPKLLAVSLFVAFSPGLEASRPVWLNGRSVPAESLSARRVPWRLLIPVTWLAMLAVGFLAPSYAFVAEMPARTLSGIFIVFVVGWLVIVFLFTRRLDSRESSFEPGGLRSSAGTSVALLILSASLLLGGNTLEGLRDLASRKVMRWHASVENRYALLRKPGAADRDVPPLAPSSRLFYSGEIWPAAPDWHIEDYFHLRSIHVKFPARTGTTAAPESELRQAQPTP